MNSSVNEFAASARAKRVRVTDERITVDFKDGRSVSIPTAWYPRVLRGSASERAKVEIWDDGIIWPDLNADVSYDALFRGRKSGESAKSFRRWLSYHSRGEREPIPTLPMPPGLAKALERSRRPRSRKLVKTGK